MKLLFCIQCQQGVYDIQSLTNDQGLFFCPSCQKPLYYLGREIATLSPISAFEEYDSKHWLTDKLSQFKGKVSNYTSFPVDHDIMECEELLRHNPDNTEALFHLGMLYKSRTKLELATHYFKKIITADPTLSDAYRQLAHIAMIQGHYTLAVDYLNTIQTHPNSQGVDQFHLAVAYYFSGQKSHAITQLNSLKKILPDGDMKAKVSTLLSQIVD
jgi:tetratricopeptide (TPR) repeat protein